MSKLVNSVFESYSMQRTSAWLARACLVLVIVLPLLVVAYWFVADASMLAVRANLLPSAIQKPLQDWQRVVGALLTMIPVVLMVRGLWEARMCFMQFAVGHVFTAQAVQRLRSFAAWISASSLGSILINPLLSVLLTLNNAPNTRHLAIGIGTDQILSLLFATMVWVMASVIAQGQALAEENSSFV